MSLDVDGNAILSHGEFSRLTKALPEGFTGTGILQAWWGGEEIDPATLHSTLNVEVRMAVADEMEPFVDTICERLERAYPDQFVRGAA